MTPVARDCGAFDLISPAAISRLRLALAAASLIGIAACGQTWNGNPAFVTVGGKVTGLDGTIALTNNGTDPITVTQSGGTTSTSNGSAPPTTTQDGTFTFDLSIAAGSAYLVAVTKQPAGQFCTLSNASGTTTSNVTNVGIACVVTPTVSFTVTGLSGTLVMLNTVPSQNLNDELIVTKSGTYQFPTALNLNAEYTVSVKTQPPGETCTVGPNATGTITADVTVSVTCQPFTLRPLPAIYKTGKAVNYSPYRAGGPNAGEVPSNANIIQDLQLLQQAGFNLVRLFGADAVGANILSLAATNAPSLKFQVGIYLEGAPSSCVDTLNQAQIKEGIVMANTYPNVVAVSVGNETSFAANLPVGCLLQYVEQVRSAVTQPVTADDDYTFYAGLSATGEKPDTVLAALDFVSIHTYPFSDTSLWDWQQTQVALTGAAVEPRATAMMQAALAQAQHAYSLVAAYPYKTAAGVTSTIGATLPITVGETGWKAVPTNTANPIERVVNPAIASPVNQKWYYDLMGTWTGANAPVTVFYFEAFDEAWKGTDDGWGLWDKTRTARYALCGTPVGGACNSPLYSGAGYYH